MLSIPAAMLALVPQPILPVHRVSVSASGIVPARTYGVQMINLFGNNDESNKRRDALSLRSAPPGSRVVTFRKENAATQGLQLGLKFKESFGKAVYIDKILPGSQAARLEKQGKLKKGDEVVMVSATFGDEMWSSRGIGKQRLEKSIAVRQGQTIKFALEASDDNSRAKKRALAEKLKKEQAMTSRLQQELAKEVDAAKSKPKGKLFGLF